MNRIWFARARAIIWAMIGIASFPLGWSDSVVLVWIASVYANVESGWATSEAADDTDILERLDRIEALLTNRKPEPGSDPHCDLRK